MLFRSDGDYTATCTVTVTETSLPTGASVMSGTISGAPAGTTVNLYISDSDLKASVPAGYTLIATTTTDAAGNYRFENLPAGKYIVMAEMNGYNSQPSDVISLNGVASANSINFKVNTTDKTIVPTGVTGYEISDTPLANIYPNPTSDVLTLQFEKTGEYIVTISDISGKVLHRQTVNDQIVKMDMNAFPAGVYLIMIDDGKQKNTTRIVKK